MENHNYLNALIKALFIGNFIKLQEKTVQNLTIEHILNLKYKILPTT